MPLNFPEGLVGYRQDGYDWRAFEAEVNPFEQEISHSAGQLCRAHVLLTSGDQPI